MSRKSGYYWVLYANKWMVAAWRSDYTAWEIPFYETAFDDSDFTEIDPNPIVREEEITHAQVKNLIDDFEDKDFGDDYYTGAGTIITEFSWNKTIETLYKFANTLLGTNYKP